MSSAGCFSRAKTVPTNFTSTNPWLTSKEREVQNSEGHWNSLRILPRKSTPRGLAPLVEDRQCCCGFAVRFLGLSALIWQEGKRIQACVALQSTLGFQFVL